MPYQGAIFDVDGVLVDSPHELAWREALQELMEGDWRDIHDQTSWTAERFTTQVYQQVMPALGPRLSTSGCPTWIGGSNITPPPSRST
jgi:phosphoglycolate phosphatase-like HAD superfamily hydrolase